MLPKKRRIVKLSEWQRMHKRGIGAHSAEMVMKYAKNNLEISRFGFIVGTKISKKANRRNLIKRRIRDVIETNLSKIKDGYDIIFIAKPKIIDKNYAEIEYRVKSLLTKKRIFVR